MSGIILTSTALETEHVLYVQENVILNSFLQRGAFVETISLARQNPEDSLHVLDFSPAVFSTGADK